MKRSRILLICFACGIGCNRGDEIAQNVPSSDQPRTTQSAAYDEIQRALAQISVGTRGADLVASLKPKSVDFGTVYWGGTGAHRMYFQIAPNQQIWFELSGAPNANVTMIGPIEAKTEWTRLDGDSIIVK